VDDRAWRVVPEYVQPASRDGGIAVEAGGQSQRWQTASRRPGAGRPGFDRIGRISKIMWWGRRTGPCQSTSSSSSEGSMRLRYVRMAVFLVTAFVVSSMAWLNAQQRGRG